MTQRIQSFVIPTGSTNNVIAGVLNQFFQVNPEITLQDISVRFEERGADYRYQIVVAYESAGGTTYGAIEFIDNPLAGATASQALANWFLNNPYDLLKTWNITRSKSRFTHPTRILAIYQPRATQYLTLGNVHFPAQAEESVLTATAGQFSQLSNVAVQPDRLEANNLGGLTWPAQTNGLLVNAATAGHGGLNCCGVAGADDILPLPISPVGAACNAGGPPVFFDPPDPQDRNNPPDPTDPAKNNCCLTYDHVCQCINNVDVWVLTNIRCLPNDQCLHGWFYYTCNDLTAHWERKYACRCGAPLPAVVPDPTCPPRCCTPPPPPPDCCLQAVFDCEDTFDEATQTCTSKWTLTSIACVDNADCAPDATLTEQDLDLDNVIDHVEYEEQGLCECGENDQNTLLQLLPAPDFQAQANNPIRVPSIEAACCPVSCCTHVKYICVEDYGESVWQFDAAECISNDSDGCEHQGAPGPNETENWVCDPDGEWAEVYLRSGCLCEDQGAITQATGEGVLFSTVEDECVPDCIYWDCVYTWESEWDCISGVWGDPVLGNTECVADGISQVTAWAYMAGAGNECKATRKTAEEDACTVGGSDCPTGPDTPDGPTLAEPSNCCYDCVYHWESEWNCDTSEWSDPVEVSRECVSGGVEEDWAYDTNPGRECFAIRTTVQENDCTIDDTTCPDPE
jgi:hypothetical protein